MHMPTNKIRGAVAGFTAAPGGGAAAFNPMAAGKKHYGLGQRSNPNQGMSGYTPGYGRRDAEAAARRDALIRRAGS